MSCGILGLSGALEDVEGVAGESVGGDGCPGDSEIVAVAATPNLKKEGRASAAAAAVDAHISMPLFNAVVFEPADAIEEDWIIDQEEQFGQLRCALESALASLSSTELRNRELQTSSANLEAKMEALEQHHTVGRNTLISQHSEELSKQARALREKDVELSTSTNDTAMGKAKLEEALAVLKEKRQETDKLKGDMHNLQLETKQREVEQEMMHQKVAEQEAQLTTLERKADSMLKQRDLVRLTFKGLQNTLKQVQERQEAALQHANETTSALRPDEAPSSNAPDVNTDTSSTDATTQHVLSLQQRCRKAVMDSAAVRLQFEAEVTKTEDRQRDLGTARAETDELRVALAASFETQRGLLQRLKEMNTAAEDLNAAKARAEDQEDPTGGDEMPSAHHSMQMQVERLQAEVSMLKERIKTAEEEHTAEVMQITSEQVAMIGEVSEKMEKQTDEQAVTERNSMQLFSNFQEQAKAIVASVEQGMRSRCSRLESRLNSMEKIRVDFAATKQALHRVSTMSTKASRESNSYKTKSERQAKAIMDLRAALKKADTEKINAEKLMTHIRKELSSKSRALDVFRTNAKNSTSQSSAVAPKDKSSSSNTTTIVSDDVGPEDLPVPSAHQTSHKSSSSSIIRPQPSAASTMLNSSRSVGSNSRKAPPSSVTQGSGCCPCGKVSFGLMHKCSQCAMDLHAMCTGQFVSTPRRKGKGVDYTCIGCSKAKRPRSGGKTGGTGLKRVRLNTVTTRPGN